MSVARRGVGDGDGGHVGREWRRDTCPERLGRRELVLEIVNGHAAILVAQPKASEHDRSQVYERAGQREVFEIAYASGAVAEAVQIDGDRHRPAPRLKAGYGQGLRVGTIGTATA